MQVSVRQSQSYKSSIIKMTRLPLLSKLTSHGDGHDCQSQSVSEAVTMVHTGDPSTIIGCRSQVEKFQLAIQGLSIVKSFKVSIGNPGSFNC